ncbi:hypothetical protein GUITHDRAFT_139907 [Guillardia theta CCMP2712]|uniref:J domain-containing protein n=1 Tax=Guillardia theta (strain CCMP2712) TaxID=905079 RepID=L1J7T4_GUITC|nr:hypothetical protein GUITHDRAFT_139907 [Guillardia theta CCMP2712]EKX44377.1 hypothetical protein GUITHDRAFT_139907 [Guillardia theta CCMP2712]|eukprot:XP_005831357.1 hypothetical protein GUITHDRAFT_139907 [Guillardia theta CCMP2712]
MHVEISWQRLFPALLALMVFLYLWDGLSGLTSGTLFLIVMPEFTARLKGKLATIGFFLLVILISAPIGALVIGAMYFEREMMEVPEQYKSTAKWVRACDGYVAGAVLVFSWGLCMTCLLGVVLGKLLGATCWALLCCILSDDLVVEEKCTCQCLWDWLRDVFFVLILGARPESVPDYYSIIGVRRGADAGEIKKQFRELSKIYHPDKTAGNPELQQRFVQISEAVRKLTGKATDRAAYYKELETAELTDMVTRSVYYCLLFGLWFLMTVLAFLGNRKQQAAGGEGVRESVEEGQGQGQGREQEQEKVGQRAGAARGATEEGAVAQEPKPKVPRSKGQKYWLLLSLLVYPLWLWVEAYWKD